VFSRSWLVGLIQLCLIGLLVLAGWGLVRFLRRRKPFRLAVAIIILATGAVALYSTVEPSLLRTVHTEILLDEGQTSQSLRIAFLSDFHLGLFAGADRLATTVERANQEQPDIILLGGDFVYRASPSALGDLLAPLQNLRAPLGVFAVLGNHDYGKPGTDVSAELARLFVTWGIHLLHNEQVAMNGWTLVGIDDFEASKANLMLAVKGVPADRPAIFLCHNGDVLLDQDPATVFPNGGVDRFLWLFGHTHGGQARLPGIGPLFRAGKSPWILGLYPTEWGQIFLTAGTGETWVPIRFNCRPEVGILDCRF